MPTGGIFLGFQQPSPTKYMVVWQSTCSISTHLPDYQSLVLWRSTHLIFHTRWNSQSVKGTLIYTSTYILSKFCSHIFYEFLHTYILIHTSQILSVCKEKISLEIIIQKYQILLQSLLTKYLLFIKALQVLVHIHS